MTSDDPDLLPLRWAKLRFAMIPFTTLMEPVTECLLLGALGALAARCLLQVDLIVFYLVHVLSWFLLDWLMLSVVQVRCRGGQRGGRRTAPVARRGGLT